MLLALLISFMALLPGLAFGVGDALTGVTDLQLRGQFFQVKNYSSGVPAMHAALMANGNVVFLDKVEAYTQLRLPNGHPACSSVYDPITQESRPLSYSTNAFCAAGAFLPDGRLVALGGNIRIASDPTVTDGYDGIRYLDAMAEQDGWSEPGNKLASNRWYGTAQTLSNGSVFVASGSITGEDFNNRSKANPTFEILDAQGRTYGNNMRMDILDDNIPVWMYPVSKIGGQD